MKRTLHQSATDAGIDCLNAECHSFIDVGRFINVATAQDAEAIWINAANHNVLIMF